MLGLCRMLLRDPVEAEDASQQAFLSAYRSLLGGTRPEHPAAWLATIARNECWGRIQEGMRRPVPDQVTEELVSPLPGPVESAARRADLAALVSAIGALPSQQREALLMREFSGLSYAELSSALSVSEPAVESLLVRARRELRLRLQPVYATTLVPVLWVRDWFGRVASGQEPVLGTMAKIGAVPLAAKLAAGVATVAVVGGVVVGGDVDRATRLPAEAAKVIGVGDASAGEPTGSPGAAVQGSGLSGSGADRTEDGRGSGGRGGEDEGSSDDGGPSGSSGSSSGGLPASGADDRGKGEAGAGSGQKGGSGSDDRPSPSSGSGGTGSSTDDDPAGGDDEDDPVDEAEDEADDDSGSDESGEEERADDDGGDDGTGEGESGESESSDDGEVEDDGERSGDDSGTSGGDGSDDEPDEPDDPEP